MHVGEYGSRGGDRRSVQVVTSHRVDLREYYEAEAHHRLRGALRGPRLGWRADFIELLRAEHRTSVADFGAGPGHDVAGFREAGLAAIGFDLAVGNARLAKEDGCIVVPADINQPPVRAGSFEAVWSMSTLMHLPDEMALTALRSIAATTMPGSPLVIGVWGGADEFTFDEEIAGQRRPFYRRSVATNRAIFSACATVTGVDEYDMGTSGYQVFALRSI